MAVETVFGAANGHSLVQDLYLASLRGTAQEALNRGENPQAVWDALLEETQSDLSLRYVHRFDTRQLRELRGR